MPTILSKVLRISGLTVVLALVDTAAWSAPPHAPRPGGIAIIDLPDGGRPTVHFDGKPVLVMRDRNSWHAVLGVPLEADPQAPLQVDIVHADGTTESLGVELDDANYRVQRLNVDRKYVEPDAQALERIFAEREVIDAALAHWREVEIADLSFEPPIPGKRSTSFGSRRIFNDQPRSPHKGMDISGTTGTPIIAPMPGIVSVTGDFYFNGNTVIVDHGQGLISLYCHLSEIDVTSGQVVDAGERLGAVGATGRVTGAHLHFATYLNATAVDPGLLLVAR